MPKVTDATTKVGLEMGDEKSVTTTRLPATVFGTSSRRQRAEAKASKSATTTTTAKLLANAETAKAKLAEHAQTAKAKFVEHTDKARSRSRELQEKAGRHAESAKAKLAEHTKTAKAKTAEVRAKARIWTGEKKVEASIYFAGWLEEVRTVGYWSHPGPLTLGCGLTLTLLFLGCSLGSTWPVTPWAWHHVPTQQDSISTAALPGLSASDGPAVVALEPAQTLEQKVPQKPLHYEWNTRRYFAAQSALQTHQFHQAHELLVGLSHDGALDTPAGDSWENFGNFSRPGFLTDLGTTMVFTGQYREAVALLGSGVVERPTGAALNALGIAYRNSGDLRSALGAFELSTGMNPRNAKAWSNLGVVAMELKKYKKADDAFYYAAEALGLEAAMDEALVNNIQILQNRVLGVGAASETAALELWWENEEGAVEEAGKKGTN